MSLMVGMCSWLLTSRVARSIFPYLSFTTPASCRLQLASDVLEGPILAQRLKVSLLNAADLVAEVAFSLRF